MPGKYHLLTAVALGAGAAALSAAVADRFTAQPGMPGGAVIRDTTGKTVGSLRIRDDGTRNARVTVNVKDLPPGYHGFHIHTKGVCDPKSTDPKTGSPFFSAGPHLDLGRHFHPDHTGDLPDLMVTAAGTGRATFTTDRFQLRQLLDADGSAIIIHAQADNKANIPQRYQTGGKPGPDAESRKTGDSGNRIACGVIAKR